MQGITREMVQSLEELAAKLRAAMENGPTGDVLQTVRDGVSDAWGELDNAESYLSDAESHAGEAYSYAEQAASEAENAREEAGQAQSEAENATDAVQRAKSTLDDLVDSLNEAIEAATPAEPEPVSVSTPTEHRDFGDETAEDVTVPAPPSTDYPI